MLIGRILRQIGFEVMEAQNGRDALDKLREVGGSDVALVDWNMPEMNGYEFVCAVRADSQYDEMTLMMVTTETETGQVRKALEAGANEYVMKPFTKDALIEKLDSMGMIPDVAALS